MKRTFLMGIAAAVIGGLGLFIASSLGMSFTNTILGVGAGVIAAVVPIGSPALRLVGVIIGIALGVFFAMMRLGMLPGGASIGGSAVTIAVILIVVAVISGLSNELIGAWTMLLGALSFIAGFSPILQTTPWTAFDDLPTSILSTLAMVGIGFLTVVPAEFLIKDRPPVPESFIIEPAPPPAPAQQPSSSIDQIIGGAQ